MARLPPGVPPMDTVKRAVRRRDAYRCTKCGLTNQQHLAETGRQLQVHRIVPGSYYTVDGCVTLCRTCHRPEPRRAPGEADFAHRKLSLSPREYELLRQLAGRNKRPIAWEARIAIHNALIEAGLMTREEADSMERDS